MKKYTLNILVFIGISLSNCNHTVQNSVRDILSKEKIKVTFNSFFDHRNNREVTNLDAQVEVKIPTKITQLLKASDAAVKYDKEGEKKTIESLANYLRSLRNYTRFVFGFTFDSIDCKIETTESFDVTHIIMEDKRSQKTHYISECFFVSGTILKIIDTELKGDKGDFSEPIKERIITSMFDENKLFYKTEEKVNGAEHDLKLNNDAAFLQIQDAFLFRQLCSDAALRLKDQHPELFKIEPAE